MLRADHGLNSEALPKASSPDAARAAGPSAEHFTPAPSCAVLRQPRTRKMPTEVVITAPHARIEPHVQASRTPSEAAGRAQAGGLGKRPNLACHLACISLGATFSHLKLYLWP